MPRGRIMVFSREIPKQHTSKDQKDQKANQSSASGARTRSRSPHIPSSRQFHQSLAHVNVSIAQTQESVKLVNRSINALTGALGHLHHTFHKASDRTSSRREPCSCKKAHVSKTGDTLPHRHCIRCDKK